MWYVIWTTTGSEEKCRTYVEQFCDRSSYKRCVIPYRKDNKKVKGVWVTIQKKVFPSYVFVETETIEDFAVELSKIYGFNYILHTENYYNALNDREERLIRRFIGDGDIVEVSKGIIVGTEVKISEGPLKGMEGSIKKIVRHKRFAIVEVELFERKTEVQLGLEILEKREN